MSELNRKGDQSSVFFNRQTHNTCAKKKKKKSQKHIQNCIIMRAVNLHRNKYTKVEYPGVTKLELQFLLLRKINRFVLYKFYQSSCEKRV